MKNWFEIGVGLYLLAMVLYGHYRGFLRMAVSMAALVLSFVIVHIALPPAITFIKNETSVVSRLEEGIEQTLLSEGDFADSAEYQAAIQQLNLPKEIQELLLSGDGFGLYDTLGGYISRCLTELIINAVGFAVLFALVYVGIHLIMKCLDIMAKLPILSGINRLAGAVLGGVQGILFVWLLFALITAFSQSDWAGSLIMQIEDSRWLPFLYHYNPISKLVLGLTKVVFH